MRETQKPFACTSPGCPMTFTNEDHLTIHLKKHDMNLNLELNCKNSYVADQTPTPTRFIRNCEEVGLFQDLQNVNPFEETFRKAVETGKVGCLHIPEVTQDDTLHTPQIYPPLEETRNVSTFSISRVPSIDENLLPAEDKSVTYCESPCVKNSEDIIITIHEKQDDFSVSPTLNLKNNLLLRRFNSKNSELDIDSESPTSKITDIKTKIKNALKNRQKSVESDLRENHSLLIQQVTVVDVDEIKGDDTYLLKAPCTRTLSPTKTAQNYQNSVQNYQKLAQNSQKPIQISLKRLATSPIYIEDDPLPDNLEKKRAINRAAQSRSRARKKLWHDSMEKQMENVKQANKALGAENKILRSEVDMLRNVLDLYEDHLQARDPDIVTHLQELTKTMRQSKDKPNSPEHRTPQNSKYVPIVPQNNAKKVVTIIPTVVSSVASKNAPLLSMGANNTISVANMKHLVPITILPITNCIKIEQISGTHVVRSRRKD